MSNAYIEAQRFIPFTQRQRYLDVERRATELSHIKEDKFRLGAEAASSFRSREPGDPIALDQFKLVAATQSPPTVLRIGGTLLTEPNLDEHTISELLATTNASLQMPDNKMPVRKQVIDYLDQICKMLQSHPGDTQIDAEACKMLFFLAKQSIFTSDPNAREGEKELSQAQSEKIISSLQKHQIERAMAQMMFSITSRDEPTTDIELKLAYHLFQNLGEDNKKFPYLLEKVAPIFTKIIQLDLQLKAVDTKDRLEIKEFLNYYREIIGNNII